MSQKYLIVKQAIYTVIGTSRKEREKVIRLLLRTNPTLGMSLIHHEYEGELVYH